MIVMAVSAWQRSERGPCRQTTLAVRLETFGIDGGRCDDSPPTDGGRQVVTKGVGGQFDPASRFC